MATPPISAVALGWTFFCIGCQAFGGLGATLALMERELVERRRAISPSVMSEAVAYTKLLPGSTAVQVVAFLGFRLGGWGVSALATIAFLLPPALLMLFLAGSYDLISQIAAFASIRRGVLVAVVVLLLASIARLMRPFLVGFLPRALALAAFAAAAGLGIGAGWLVVAAGLVGVVRRR